MLMCSKSDPKGMSLLLCSPRLVAIRVRKVPHIDDGVRVTRCEVIQRLRRVLRLAKVPNQAQPASSQTCDSAAYCRHWPCNSHLGIDTKHHDFFKTCPKKGPPVTLASGVVQIAPGEHIGTVTFFADEQAEAGPKGVEAAPVGKAGGPCEGRRTEA
jgi:hypothetical protein